MNIQRVGSQPSNKGPADWFTGAVRIDSPFKGTEPARASGAIVSFEPAPEPPGTPTHWGSKWYARPVTLRIQALI
jgi:hypothetical protein